MHEYEADIIRTEYTANNTSMIELSCAPLAGTLMPGQFLQLRAGAHTDPFLRRTISVAGVDRDNGIVRLLIEQVGTGTRIICGDTFGTVLNVIGPLGNTFDLDINPSCRVVLAAGGIGVAPLLFLAQTLRERGHDRMILLMGARNREGLSIIGNLLPDGIEMRVSTDDGSAGHHGFITDLLEEELRAAQNVVVYTCGPKPMMKRVKDSAANAGCRCQVSLEERMACGFGACYGCAVERVDGSIARVCKDGPVFEGGEVRWS